MKGSLLKNVMQWEMSDGKGFSGKLPVFYRDNTSMTATFTASTKIIKKILPDPKMFPVELFPGRCVIGFTAFEYRDSDIGPYNEFSIAILISYGKKTIPGADILTSMMSKDFTAYVWHLPVTTEPARYGGVELYGYPKIVADIKFIEHSDRLECQLSENGESILSFTGKKLNGSQGKTLRYRTYSVKDGIPLCANIYTNPIKFAQTMDSKAAQLQIGKTHSISRALNEIGLSKNPIMYQYSELNESILFAPRNLIDN